MFRKTLLTVLLTLAIGTRLLSDQPDRDRWRGFDLTDLTYEDHSSDATFREWDFARIAAWGFNFVRLPLNYRYWTDPADWHRILPERLEAIDQAIRWGEKYKLHVCINFHHAPGYHISDPENNHLLWKNADALKAFASQWTFFARRYRDIPSTRLSFNLLNEPPYYLSEKDYLKVVNQLVSAIRAEDPERLILVDGLNAGRIPLQKLPAENMLQATRGYEPFSLTHYLAEWAPGNETLPFWPPKPANSYLYGPIKGKLASPLTISGPFPTGSLHLKVGTVTDFATLQVLFDNRLAMTAYFEAAAGGGVEPPVLLKKWKVYETRYDRSFEIPVPDGTSQIRIGISDGDWLTLEEVAFATRRGKQVTRLRLAPAWGETQPPVSYQSDKLVPQTDSGRDFLRENMLAPWSRLPASRVFVGEWGTYNKTPHDVTLAWMEDSLNLWKEAGWGWALWNFRGDFGVLDSGRSDVKYENFRGHKLDRKMLQLLQKY